MLRASASRQGCAPAGCGARTSRKKMGYPIFSTMRESGFRPSDLRGPSPRAGEARALVARIGRKPDSRISPGPDCAPQPTGAQPCRDGLACGYSTHQPTPPRSRVWAGCGARSGQSEAAVGGLRPLRAAARGRFRSERCHHDSPKAANPFTGAGSAPCKGAERSDRAPQPARTRLRRPHAGLQQQHTDYHPTRRMDRDASMDAGSSPA